MNIVSSGAAALLLAVSCAVTPAFAMPGAGDGAAARVSDPAERFRQIAGRLIGLLHRKTH